MSVASSFPCIKISTSSSSPSSSQSSCSSSSSSNHHSFMLSSSAKPYYVKTVRSSQTEGPIRRPVAPSLREPSPLSSPLKPTPPSPQAPPPPQQQPSNPAPVSGLTLVEDNKNVVTLEFQRQKAKEIQEYFKQKKLEAANQGPFFGFVGKNEISNGRWAMFGFAVGILTEFATGSDFVDQVKILLSNFGILDLE